MSRLTDLIKREYGLMVRYVQSRIDAAGDRDAEDIVQDVLVSVFERANPGAPIENLAAYIYRSLHNRIMDMFRRRTRTVPLSENVPESPDFEGGSVERALLLDQLFEAMDELEDHEKALILAQEFEGRPFRELSEDWDVPIGTLLARKNRAVQKLRKRLNAPSAQNKKNGG